MTVEAVLFDWGGTLTTGMSYQPSDLLAMWHAAAEVLGIEHRHLAGDDAIVDGEAAFGVGALGPVEWRIQIFYEDLRFARIDRLEATDQQHTPCFP